ncbi:MAG: pyroglutamyl-peptidase I [Variibacter sp.]
MRPLGRNRSLTILITGFGPFPTAPFNPTQALVAALGRIRRPSRADAKIVTHIFRTSYAAVDRDLPTLLAEHRPDVLLMFGLAARTPYVRIETQARAARSRLLADADGVLPPTAATAGKSGALRARAPVIPLLLAARRTGADIRLSRDAGRYLCNHVYRRALEISGTGAPAVALSVHVPKVARGAMTRRRSLRRPAITANDLVRVGRALLPVVTAAARRR